MRKSIVTFTGSYFLYYGEIVNWSDSDVCLENCIRVDGYKGNIEDFSVSLKDQPDIKFSQKMKAAVLQNSFVKIITLTEEAVELIESYLDKKEPSNG